MRRFFCFIVALGVVLLLGCDTDNSSFLDYQKNISGAIVTWNDSGREYTAEVVFDTDMPESTNEIRRTRVTVREPENIAGTTLSFSPDENTVSVGGVSFSLDGNMGRKVYRVVRSLSLYKSEMKGAGNGSGEVTAIRYEVPLFDGVTEYDITYGDNRLPVSAIVKWDGGEMSVKYNSVITEKTEAKTTAS